jgi:zinc protease
MKDTLHPLGFRGYNKLSNTMIQFEKKTLKNGLRVIVNEDCNTPLVCCNVMYDVGARDESPDKTGFAHLFEHLMFGGSVNVPSFDEPVQKAGGENNAFTSNDLTNFYEVMPANNLEVGLWLESDRMLSLKFQEKILDVQRKVVSEEFKEHYINQPYGDAWHQLRKLAYTTHPYRWPTIGEKLEHIEHAQLSDVKDFFFKHYRPNNAILVITGNVKADEVFKKTEEWFGDIPQGEIPKRNLAVEPRQKEARKKEIRANVPLDAIYKAYHMPARFDEKYYTLDLVSDILSGGRSSRLYEALIKNNKLFTELNAYVTASIDPGLFVIEGKLMKGVSMSTADAAIEEELEKLNTQGVTEHELQKVKNKQESNILFNEMDVMSKAINLAFFELLGDSNLINHTLDHYLSVTTDRVKEQSNECFKSTNCSTLYYLSEK